jgi:hypothetical protein
MDKIFETFMKEFVKKYPSDVFNNKSNCKSLLNDHAKEKNQKGNSSFNASVRY